MALRPLLRLALRHGFAVLGLAVGRPGWSACWSAREPRLRIRAAAIGRRPRGQHRAGLPGTDLDESVRYNTLMEQLLLEKFPDEIEHVWSRCGTAEVATDPMGPEETDFFITLKPRESGGTQADDQDELVERIAGGVGGHSRDSDLSFTQPIEQRINEMISGVAATWR